MDFTSEAAKYIYMKRMLAKVEHVRGLTLRKKEKKEKKEEDNKRMRMRSKGNNITRNPELPLLYLQ